MYAMPSIIAAGSTLNTKNTTHKWLIIHMYNIILPHQTIRPHYAVEYTANISDNNLTSITGMSETFNHHGAVHRNQPFSNSSELLPTISEQRAVAISSCHGQIGSSETEHSVSPLHECGIDCQPTSDSCVRRIHSGAILRHFYLLLLTELR